MGLTGTFFGSGLTTVAGGGVTAVGGLTVVEGGVTARHYFPVDAEYQVSIRLTGSMALANQVELRLDGAHSDVARAQYAAGVIAGMKEPVWLKGGDVVEVEVEGLGRLRTTMAQG